MQDHLPLLVRVGLCGVRGSRLGALLKSGISRIMVNPAQIEAFPGQARRGAPGAKPGPAEARSAVVKPSAIGLLPADRKQSKCT